METKKRVLITGSTQGIGKALAAAFVKRGYEVIVHGSRDAAKAERARAEIGAARAVTADLSDLAETKGLVEKTGAVDVLVLNASVQYKENWQDITDEHFETQINVNLRSTWQLIKAYYPAMKARGFGRIVTVGSVNQYRQHPELPLYAATKCAVLKLVQTVAKEAAPFGVTVNNISPGAIRTPRNEAVWSDPDQRAAVERCIPMGRFGTPEDCVGAVLLLCGDEGAYITGTDITVDGGMRL